MKYRLLAVLLCLTAAAYAIDFGGTIENDTKVGLGGGKTFDQGNRISLWAQVDFTDALVLNAKASYIYTLEDPLIYEIDAFALQGEFPILGESPFLIKLNLGRFPLADFSGMVLDNRVDGLEVVYSNSFMDFRLAGGYTGFLFKKTTKVVLTKADSNDVADDDLYFAAPRLIGLAELSFPEAFLRQNIVLTALVQFDMRPEDELIKAGETVEDPTKGGHLNSQYFGLGMGGAIVPSLYYNLFGYLETGETLSYENGEYKYAPILAFACGGKISWFLKDSLESILGLAVLFASGDNDYNTIIEGNTKGDANLFIPISKTELGVAFNPEIPNIFLISLEYSMKPLQSLNDPVWSNLQTAIKANLYFRAANGFISEDGVDLGSDSLFLGVEPAVIANFRPFSDLGMVLSLGAFLPATTADIGAMAEGSPFIFVGRFEFFFGF
jgi:hypothetical protein